MYCLDFDLRFGKSCSTLSLSDSGAHLGRPWLPSVCLVSSPLRVRMLLFDRRLPFSFLILISRWFRSSTLPSPCENLSRHKFVVHRGFESLVGGVEIVVSRFSSPSPRIVLDLGTRSSVGGSEL